MAEEGAPRENLRISRNVTGKNDTSVGVAGRTPNRQDRHPRRVVRSAARALIIPAGFALALLFLGCWDTTTIAAEVPGEPGPEASEEETETLPDDEETPVHEMDETESDTPSETPADTDVPSDTALPSDTEMASDTAIETATATDTDTGVPSDTSPPRECAPDLASISTTPTDYEEVFELPSPFAFLDGEPVTSPKAWQCRRAELRALIQGLEYGPYPPAPDRVTGVLNGEVLTVTVEANDLSVSFDATIVLPGGAGNVPAFIVISSLTPCITDAETVARGIAYITFDPLDISADGDGYTGLFYTLYDTAPHAGNLLAWAWAVHRIMDALEATPDAGIDPAKIAAAGCRRYGKAALVAGVFDERVALTVPCAGGSGGITSWRAAEDANPPGSGDRETIHNIGGAPYWFIEGFVGTWEDHVYRLPFDAHEVIALLAPRAVIAQESQYDEYNTNPEGGPFQSMWAARKVFDYLGAQDAIGFVTDAYPIDMMTPRELNAIMDMADRVLNGNTTATTTFDVSASPPAISWDAP